MRRTMALALGTAGALMLLAAPPASAQIRVDVGVATPNIGARVVLGDRPVYRGQRVYVVDRYPNRRTGIRIDRRGGGPPPWAPAWGYRRKVQSRGVYVSQDRYRWSGSFQRTREYQRDVRAARRDYERDLRDARRDLRRR